MSETTEYVPPEESLSLGGVDLVRTEEAVKKRENRSPRTEKLLAVTAALLLSAMLLVACGDGDPTPTEGVVGVIPQTPTTELVEPPPTSTPTSIPSPTATPTTVPATSKDTPATVRRPDEVLHPPTVSPP